MHPNQHRESASRVQAKVFKQSFFICHPDKRKVLSRAWIESLAHHHYFLSTQNVTSNCNTGINFAGEYHGILRWGLSALMSASGAIRSAWNETHLFCRTRRSSIVVDVTEIVHHPGLVQLRATDEQVCEQRGSESATVVFTRQLSKQA
jgi:hypothetical protein